MNHIKLQSQQSSDLDADLVDELDKALKLNETVQTSPLKTPEDTQIYHDVIEN